jgi:hypothetical protein
MGQDQGRLGGQLLRGRHDLRPNRRMLVHEEALFLVERPLLQQDVVPDPDLAHVVQQARPFDRLDLGLRQLHDAAHGLGDIAHALRMVSCVHVPGVHCLGQCRDRLLEQLACLDVAVVREAGCKEWNHEQRSCPPADAIRQSEDLGHQPGEWDQADKVQRNCSNILSPDGTEWSTCSSTYRQHRERPIRDVEDSAANQQADESNYRCYWEGRRFRS